MSYQGVHAPFEQPTTDPRQAATLRRFLGTLDRIGGGLFAGRTYHACLRMPHVLVTCLGCHTWNWLLARRGVAWATLTLAAVLGPAYLCTLPRL